MWLMERPWLWLLERRLRWNRPSYCYHRLRLQGREEALPSNISYEEPPLSARCTTGYWFLRNEFQVTASGSGPMSTDQSLSTRARRVWNEIRH